MQQPRIKIRQLMIVIAVLTLPMAACAWLYHLYHAFGAGFERAYGPEGQVTLEHRIWGEFATGNDALRTGQFDEAESSYRAALKLRDLFQAKHGRRGLTSDQTKEAELGLADALAGQGRYADAEPFYKRSFSSFEREFGGDHFGIADVLERYARFLRKTDRVSDAKQLEARATRILEHYLQANGDDDPSGFVREVEARARALRSRAAPPTAP